jgi:hypothetical protein
LDYQIYDELQASLGGVADGFTQSVNAVITSSDASDEAKSLATQLCKEVEKSFNELAVSLSEALSAIAK